LNSEGNEVLSSMLNPLNSWGVEGTPSPWSAGREVLSALVCPRVVGTGKLPGTRNSLAQLRSMFCARGDPWHWGPMSVINY
jgi:hypothetical protein